MAGLLSGWVDGWMGRWVDGLLSGWIDKWRNATAIIYFSFSSVSSVALYNASSTQLKVFLDFPPPGPSSKPCHSAQVQLPSIALVCCATYLPAPRAAPTLPANGAFKMQCSFSPQGLCTALEPLLHLCAQVCPSPLQLIILHYVAY